MALAALLGYPPAAGPMAGSAALSGGHGTVLARGPILARKFGIASASAAILTATTKKHGASPRSFLVVPLVGAFFVDIANTIVLQTFVKVLGGSRPRRGACSRAVTIFATVRNIPL